MNNSLPGPDNVTRVQLENGITVLVYENPNVQSVVIAGSLLGGSLYENHERNGLASITCGALMRGTQNRDFYTLHSNLEDIGADFGISSGAHKVSFSGKALAEDLPVLIDVLSDVVRYPSFPEAQVERLRGEILTWLQYQQQDTRRLAMRAFRENLYPANHAYHYSSRGTMETVPTLTIEEMRDYHARNYGPDRMIIVVVGAVKSGEVVEIIEKYLGDWQNPDQPRMLEVPPVNPVEEIRRTAITVPGKTQSDVVLGVVGPSRFAEDYQAANLANSILGQFGMMGRIGDVVREQSGMAYYAGSRLEGGYGPGAWLVSMGVNPVNIEKAIELSLGEVQRMMTEFVDDLDLDDNKSYFTGRLPLQLESSEGIAGTLLSMESYGLGLDYLHRYPSIINSLTKEALMAAASHYWKPEAYIVAVAGPNGK